MFILTALTHAFPRTILEAARLFDHAGGVRCAVPVRVTTRRGGMPRSANRGSARLNRTGSGSEGLKGGDSS